MKNLKTTKFEKIIEEKFAYDVTGIQEDVQQYSEEIITELVAGTRTAELIPIQEGIKYKESFRLLSTSLTAQANTDCERNPLGDIILSDKDIAVTGIKFNMDFCNKTLIGNWGQLGLRPGTMIEKEELPFADQIIAKLVKDVKKINEDLMWKGNTLLPTANLNKIDGWIKKFKAAGVVNVNTTETSWTLTNVVDSLYALRNALSTEVLEGNHAIFVGRELFDLYCQAQTNANLFHFNPINNRMEVPLHGTNTMIQLIPALSGTNEAFAGLVDFMKIGTDLVSDMDTFDVYYDRAGGGKLFVDIEYRLGVEFVYENEFKRLELVAS